MCLRRCNPALQQEQHSSSRTTNETQQTPSSSFLTRHGLQHEYVKTAIINIARSYGIQCTPEPSFYIYASGQHNRPDITFHLPTRAHLTTDITVVHSAFDGDPDKLGLKAEQAAIEKDNKHKQAVTALGQP